MDPAETADRTLDATGLLCPEPVFRTRLALAEMEPGQLLEVSADDPLAEVDMAVFCQRTGHSPAEPRPRARQATRRRVSRGLYLRQR